MKHLNITAIFEDGRIQHICAININANDVSTLDMSYERQKELIALTDQALRELGYNITEETNYNVAVSVGEGWYKDAEIVNFTN